MALFIGLWSLCLRLHTHSFADFFIGQDHLVIFPLKHHHVSNLDFEKNRLKWKTAKSKMDAICFNRSEIWIYHERDVVVSY